MKNTFPIHNMVRRIMRICLVVEVLLAGVIIGCAKEGNPSRLLDQALHTFSVQQGTLELEHSNAIILNQQPTIDWNPLVDVEKFRQQVNAVNMDTRSNSKEMVLNISMDSESAKDQLAAWLHSELEKVRKEAELTSLSSANSLGAGKLQREIQMRIAAAEQHINTWMRDSRIDSNVALWVNRRTQMPSRMEVRITIQNKNGRMDNKDEILESFLIS